MKRLNRIIALLLVMASLVLIIPTAGLASVKVAALESGKWYSTQRPGSDNRKVYRLNVAADTVVIVSWKNAHSNSSFAEVDFCRDRDCSDVVAGFEFYTPASGSKAVSLGAGTYYVGMNDVIKGSKLKFTVKPASKVYRKNTSKGKAVSVEAGKKAYALFRKKAGKPLWYRIRLTQKKAVSIYSDCENIVLYDQAMNKMNTRWDYAKNRLVSKGKLAKGVYYAKVSCDYIDDPGTCYTLYWK